MQQVSSVKDFWAAIKKKPKLLSILFIALGLLFLFGFGSKKSESVVSKISVDVSKYVNDLEARLSEQIKRFNGVEDCSVMVTLDSLENNDYLENNSISSTGNDEGRFSKDREYLVIKQNGQENVVVARQNTPKICGALIVYKGTDSTEVQKHILDAVSTVLGIQSNKVCVVAEQI